MRGLALLGLLALPSPSLGETHEVALGLEDFAYATKDSILNASNLLGLQPEEDTLRATLRAKEVLGDARAVFSGYAEHTFDPAGKNDFVVREAYLQYSWGPGLSLRVGKQRIAWGSGFAWNPTNRVEPPKDPLNTSLEQEGALAVRMDWIPCAWAGVILVGASGDTVTTDLPLALPTTDRKTAAVRARFLVKDTDIAVVLSGGTRQRSLYGFDLGRSLGEFSAHAEGAFYRGSEIPPTRDDTTFFRVATGVLFTRGTTSSSLEYFYNGEGYTASGFASYLQALQNSSSLATDPFLGAAQRQVALVSYLSEAALPYSSGLGMRRHYLQASWSRAEIRGVLTPTLRAVVSLSDGSAALTPGIGWAPRGNLTLNLDGVFLLGSKTSEYGIAPVKGALQARIKVLF